MKSMKRIVMVLLLACLLLPLVSCGGGGVKDERILKMNGWWKTVDGSFEFTIRDGKAKNWNDVEGELTMFEDIDNKYVLTFHEEKDGFTKDSRYRIDYNEKTKKYTFWITSGMTVELKKVGD